MGGERLGGQGRVRILKGGVRGGGRGPDGCGWGGIARFGGWGGRG